MDLIKSDPILLTELASNWRLWQLSSLPRRAPGLRGTVGGSDALTSRVVGSWRNRAAIRRKTYSQKKHAKGEWVKNLMPTYTFELRDGSSGIRDEIGIILPDREQALRYAHDVARELMSCRELETRFWRLDVYEDDATRVFEILFATIDQTLDHLAPHLRAMMERLCERRRDLCEAADAARRTVRESRALIALSRGKPYLATNAGRKTIASGGSAPLPL